MTPCAVAIDKIRALVKAGRTLDEAARYLKVNSKTLVDRVLDQIGSWPSSEPELAAIQRAT